MKRPASPAWLLLLLVIAFPGGGCSTRSDIRVAVASNFQPAMSEISERFEARTGRKVSLGFGSTGKHFAQIENGAPFAAFLAADATHPRLLEEHGLTVPGSRFTYALGELVLWSPEPGSLDAPEAVLARGDFRHLAIADPELAPYGTAARQVLEALGLWDELATRLVRGENVGQAFQYVASGNAELGFVAYSQVLTGDRAATGSMWRVPRSLYEPIEQQAVLLVENEVARELLDFIASDEGRAIVRRHGYALP